VDVGFGNGVPAIPNLRPPNTGDAGLKALSDQDD